jgi:hypothetical protein
MIMALHTVEVRVITIRNSTLMKVAAQETKITRAKTVISTKRARVATL